MKKTERNGCSCNAVSHDVLFAALVFSRVLILIMHISSNTEYSQQSLLCPLASNTVILSVSTMSNKTMSHVAIIKCTVMLFEYTDKYQLEVLTNNM